MSKKLRTFNVQDSVFGSDIYFVIGDAELSKKHILKVFTLTESTEELLEIDNNNMGCFNKLSHKDMIGHTFLVWLQEYNNTAENIATLAHEILHLTFEVMSTIGIEYSEYYNEEVFAHYMDSILQQAIIKLK